jgi:hypothetical protein
VGQGGGRVGSSFGVEGLSSWPSVAILLAGSGVWDLPSGGETGGQCPSQKRRWKIRLFSFPPEWGSSTQAWPCSEEGLWELRPLLCICTSLQLIFSSPHLLLLNLQLTSIAENSAKVASSGRGKWVLPGYLGALLRHRRKPRGLWATPASDLHPAPLLSSPDLGSDRAGRSLKMVDSYSYNRKTEAH